MLGRLNSQDKHVYISGIDKRAKLFFISHLFLHLKKILYIIDKNSAEAHHTCGELSYFLNNNVNYLCGRNINLNKAIYSSGSRYALEKTGWLYNSKNADLTVCDLQSLFEKVIPERTFRELYIKLSVDRILSRNDFINIVRNYGYTKTDFVQKVSEYSSRGSIIDIFSPQYPHPLRIEFLGNKIESIRHFSTENQKTLMKTDYVEIIPASEAVTEPLLLKNAIQNIRQFSREHEVRTTVKNNLINQLENGKRPDSIDFLTPFFIDNLSNIFSYLNQGTTIIFDSSFDRDTTPEIMETTINKSLNEIKAKYKIIPGFTSLYLDETEFLSSLKEFPTIFLTENPLTDEQYMNFNYFGSINLHSGNYNNESPFDLLARRMINWMQDRYRVIFILKSEKEAEKIKAFLADRKINNPEIHTGNLESGFISDELKLVLLTENDIYQRKVPRRYENTSDIDSAFITSFSELSEGDYIVHKDFGIGIYRGLKDLNIQSQKGDFLICEYRDRDKIYVPVDRLNIIQRYIGNGSTPRINKLSDPAWGKTLKRINKAVENIAKDLLELYAARKARKGYQYSKTDSMYEEFERNFEYEETTDQAKAIEDVLRDMETDKCMDRLICGDVGFGKTEVALRASFKAVMDGKQVAIVVPTTLLCFQHYHTFKSRFSLYPVNIEMLSRFKSTAQTGDIINKLIDGDIDILIGTHKLLSRKIVFKDLGLIIIDEEHKFGVKQKENIRKLKQNVDVLSLSATPIPRTLQMSLVKIRDISLINTPPQGRKEIETYIYKYDDNTIKKAIISELERGGCVFFIHNRIEDIYKVAAKISTLLPQVKYLVTHGRMNESLLQESVQKLKEGQIQLLVTTTIIESGIHIPRANTIIVNEANNFGLADLYQLRGRVGRSDQKAYAYFLVSSPSLLSGVAKKRLKAISEINELGSGFKLALSDLEIRGAGNLFGTDQSGHINDVGLEMYLDMLNKEIGRISDAAVSDDYEPEVKSFLPSYIPREYIEDNSERLLFYKRLSSCSTFKEIDGLCNELTDRFGRIPEPLANLADLICIKLHMKKNRIKKLDHRKNSFVFEFDRNSSIFDMFKPSGTYRKTANQDITANHILNTISDINREFENYKHIV